MSENKEERKRTENRMNKKCLHKETKENEKKKQWKESMENKK